MKNLQDSVGKLKMYNCFTCKISLWGKAMHIELTEKYNFYNKYHWWQTAQRASHKSELNQAFNEKQTVEMQPF